MGYHSLIEISHDQFHETEPRAEAFIADMAAYVRSGAFEQADVLDRRYDVKVVGMRHSGERYIVSGRTDGFPVRSPYEEELDAEAAGWKAVVEKAKAYLAGSVRMRTMSDLRRLVVALVDRVLTADVVIATADRAIGEGDALLADPSHSPTRAEYAGLLDDLRTIRARIEPRRSPD